MFAFDALFCPAVAPILSTPSVGRSTIAIIWVAFVHVPHAIAELVAIQYPVVNASVFAPAAFSIAVHPAGIVAAVLLARRADTIIRSPALCAGSATVAAAADADPATVIDGFGVDVLTHRSSLV